jgi:hemolysin III
MDKVNVLSKNYSAGEEIFNSVSHGAGAVLSAAAIPLLVVDAVRYAPAGSTPFYVVSYAIFGASLFILYLFSTLYHAMIPWKAKSILRIFDHSSIYLLIAGTYTPFCLAALHGPFGWTLFGVIWGLALTGITLYCIFGNRLRAASAVTYVVLGWIIVFAFRPLTRVLPHISLAYLIAGGIAYTAGCPFYALKKVKWMHCIFHVFVLAGSILHFFSVYLMIP